MTTSKKRIARFAALSSVALLIGLPAATSHAHEPTTVAQAQALAQQSHVRAEKAEALGGVGYKSGEVQRAETDEARYTAMAEEIAEPLAPPSPPTPVADHYAAVAHHYRAMGGGPAYKWRRVEHAEMQEQRWARAESAGSAYAPPARAEAPQPAATYPACENVSKPVVRTLACAQ